MPFDGAQSLGAQPAAAGLGSNRINVEGQPKSRGRSRFSFLKRALGRVIPDSPAASCCDHVAHHRAGVEVRQNKDRAKYVGLAHCQRGAFCPICRPAIQKKRREKIADGFRSAKEQGLQLVFLTLTIRHSHGESLKAIESRLSGAWRKMIQRVAWRRFIRVGYIKIIETPYGDANSWHPHYHLLMFVRADSQAEAVAHCETLRKHWESAVEAVGGSANDHAFDVRGGDSAESYLTKIDDGTLHEMTDSGSKSGKAGSRTPMQLLADFADHGDSFAAHRFREFVQWSKGRRMIDWSKGLADALGIENASPDDDQIEIDGMTDDLADEDETVMLIPKPAWRDIVHACAQIRVLEIVESEGAAAAWQFIQSLPPAPPRTTAAAAAMQGRRAAQPAVRAGEVLAPGRACGARTI